MENAARVPGVQIRRIRFYAATLPVILAVTVGGIVGLATSGVVSYLVIGVCAVGGALAIWRSLRLDLLADHHGVVVTNFWRTYRFAWSEVVLVRLAYLRVGVVPQTAIAFWVKGRKPVLVQATPIGRAGQGVAFDHLARLATPGTPVGPDARRDGANA